MSIFLEDLKAKALAATPGEWTLRDRGVICGGPVTEYFRGKVQPQIVMCCGGEQIGHEQKTANEHFIVAARPEVVLDLLERLENAESERDALKAELSMEQNRRELAEEDIEVLHINLDLLGIPRSASETLSAWWRVTYLRDERDQFKAELEAARKQEPYAEWKIFNKGGSGEFGQLVSNHPMHDGQKLYASPVPAQQAEYPDYPMQPIINGRFEANPIVYMLVDHVGLNEIAVWWQENEIPVKYTEQLAQLIGYSLGGYSELSYVSDESYERAMLYASPKEPPCATE